MKKTVAILIMLVLCFALGVVATAAQQITEPLDLTTQETTDNLAAEGWKWDAESKTLTLNGFDLSVSSGHAVTVPDGTTVILAANSVNTITAGANSYGIYIDGDFTVKSADSANKGKLTIKTPYRGIGNNGGSARQSNTLYFENIDLEINANRGINTVANVVNLYVTMNGVTFNGTGNDRTVQVYNNTGNVTFTVKNCTINTDGMLYCFAKNADAVMTVENSTITAKKLKLGWWNNTMNSAQLDVNNSTLIISNIDGSDAAIEVGINYATTSKAILTNSKIIAINNKDAAISVSQKPVGYQTNESARGDLKIENCKMILADKDKLGLTHLEKATITDSSITTMTVDKNSSTHIFSKDDTGLNLTLPIGTPIKSGDESYVVETENKNLIIDTKKNVLSIPDHTVLETDKGNIESEGIITIAPGQPITLPAGKPTTITPTGKDPIKITPTTDTPLKIGDDGTIEVPAGTIVENSNGETTTLDNGGKIKLDGTVYHMHTWDEGVVTTEPTEDADGVITYTCGGDEGCGETRTATIPKLEPAPEVKPENKPESCDHNLDANGKCTKCGVIIISYTDGKAEASEDEINPGTGAPVISSTVTVVMLAAAACVLKKK